MDILHLVDRLEELFNQSRPIWLTHSVIVDEERMLDIIDQMRVSIPEEIKKSQQIYAQRDRIIAQAKEEANRILALSSEKSSKLVEEHDITQAAKARADQIIEQARREAVNTQREADQYVIESLGRLEVEMDRLLGQVRNGLRALQAQQTPQGRQQAPASDQPSEL